MQTNFKDMFRQGSSTVPNPFEDAFSNRRLYFCEELTDRSAARLIAMLHCLEGQSDDDICLYINSPGGSWSSALAVVDVIKNMYSPVHTVCCGRVWDGAVLIAAEGTRGRRYIMQHTEIVINPITEDSFAGVKDLEMRAVQLAELRSRVQSLLSARTGQSLHEVEKDTRRPLVFTAREAVRYGIADIVGEAMTFL